MRSIRFTSGPMAILLSLTMLLAALPAWAQQKPRIEKDLLGEKEVPADAYYGVQTARALENFQISGVPINHYPGFIEAWAIVKLAAARANTDVGAMKQEALAAIEKAAEAVLARQVPRPVPGRLVPGRRRHLDQHERQRGAGQRRARADRAQEGRVQDRRAARPPEHVAVDERLLPDGDQGGVHPAQRQADRRAGEAGRVVPREGRRVSSTSSRWAAPSCRTRCR